MSKPQVTITLGRSGQVVKRPGSALENNVHSDHQPSSGSKRCIRDRLGNNGDKSSSNGTLQKNKRQRRDGNKRSSANDDVNGNKQKHYDDVNGARVNPNDLRYKLMRKSKSRRTRSDSEEQQSKRDLREKLSRTAPPPTRPDTQHCMPESKDANLLRRVAPTRSADDLFQMDSVRNSYSAWTSDGVRRRSPDRILGTSRGLSPPRNMDNLRPVSRGLSPPRSMDNLRHVSTIRPVGAARPPYMGKDVLDASRPTSFMVKTSVPLEPGKPIMRLPPPSAPGTTQKLYMGEEPLTVANLLHSLGLGKYAILFQAEEVDMTALKQMGDQDLKELGIPMGPRKKIILAVLSHFKRPPRGL